MPQQLFLQNIIACIWDFDKTLIPGYMQTPIFEHYEVDPKKFWKEVNALPQYYQKNDPNLIVPDTVYLNHIVTYTRERIFKGLNNALLRKFGAKLEFYKGTNKIPDIDVNAKIPDEDRRVPFQNMIYVADGPSDIPVFSIINQFGGRTFAVYRPGSKEEFSQVNTLQKQGRVQSFGEANYTAGSQTAMWLKNAISEIADQIVTNRERAMGDKIGKPPKHLD